MVREKEYNNANQEVKVNPGQDNGAENTSHTLKHSSGKM